MFAHNLFICQAPVYVHTTISVNPLSNKKIHTGISKLVAMHEQRENLAVVLHGKNDLRVVSVSTHSI